MLVVALFGPKGVQPFDLLPAVSAAIRANQLGWAVLSLVVSHGLFGGLRLVTGSTQKRRRYTLKP